MLNSSYTYHIFLLEFTFVHKQCNEKVDWFTSVVAVVAAHIITLLLIIIIVLWALGRL
jgi:hypothetical protein